MKLFSRCLSPFLFLFFSLPLAAQFNSGKYDRESFLIGSLGDYMGYRRTFTDRVDSDYRRVDIMSLKRALFIDSLFSSDYKDVTLIRYEKSGRVIM